MKFIQLVLAAIEDWPKRVNPRQTTFSNQLIPSSQLYLVGDEVSSQIKQKNPHFSFLILKVRWHHVEAIS